MEIIWRRGALRDLEEARRYIAQDNLAAADRVRDAIMTAVGGLAEMSHTGRPGRVEYTRELVVPGTPYIVAYTVFTGGEVMILAVITARGDGRSGFSRSPNLSSPRWAIAVSVSPGSK